MTRIQKLTRRHILKVAATSAAVPMFLPGRLFGAEAPSKQITLGSIGIGWNEGPFGFYRAVEEYYYKLLKLRSREPSGDATLPAPAATFLLATSRPFT